MNLNKSIGMALTVFVTSGILFSCNPGNNAPNGTTPPATGNGATVGAEVTVSNPTNVSTQSQTAVELQNALIAAHDEDDTFADASAVANAEGGFETKQLREVIRQLPPEVRESAKAEVTATARERLENATPEQRAQAARLVRRKVMRKVTKVKLVKRASTKTVRKAVAANANLKAKAMVHANVAKNLKARLEASGAVTVNEDGTFTVDPMKAKEHAKMKLQERRDMLMAKKEKAKAKLQEKKEVAKDKLEKLRRKNQVARSSEVETIENADGTTTKLRTVQFENKRTTVKRDITVARTFSADGKLMSVDYSLEASSKNHTRSAHRLMTVNEDGSRTITHESTTKWTNGKMRVVSFERVVDANGNATGGGTITITMPDGTTKTHTMTISTSASGEVVTSADAEDSDTEVVVEENAEGDATVTVSEEGEAEDTEEVVDVEEAAAEEEAGETGSEETVQEEVEAVVEEEAPAAEAGAEAEAEAEAGTNA